MAFTAIVFDADPRRPWLAARTERSLRRAGATCVLNLNAGEPVPQTKGPAVMVRAGAWLRHVGPILLPPVSATGRGVFGVGLPLSGPSNEEWKSVQAKCGGDFSFASGDLPPVLALVSMGRSRRPDASQRVIHWPSLDVEDEGEALRVVQLVTSLQRGGAEQVTWDLHDVLPPQGVASCLVTLGRPLRSSLPVPAGHFSLADRDSSSRVDAVQAIAARFGADLIHAHLIRADDAHRIAQSGVPLVMTVHNTRAGWPEGLDSVTTDQASLLVACAQAVEREISDARIPVPARTAWNGIDVGKFASKHRRQADPTRLTLTCIANPRPQKRLHLLPAVLNALRLELSRRRDARNVCLIIAGEAPSASVGSECLEHVKREAEALGVSELIESTDGQRDVGDVLGETDVLVSLSAHEGLSLAHLEALAAGVPVVATSVGGTPELAEGHPAVTLLRVDVPPDVVAKAVLHAASGPRPEADLVRRHFSRERMAARYAWLYRAVLGPRPGKTLWFVANNLCTGGAQSSLRRLVKTFHADGIRVHVALLQEQQAYPTAGRNDLLQAGIPVTVLPPPVDIDAAEAVEVLLADMCADPPRSVTFWNAIQSYKMLIADALLHVPVFDVSPGEMFYDSLDAYFARPRPGLPYRDAREYGERLAGVIVKYSAEAVAARERLATPVHVIPNGVALLETPHRAARKGPVVIGTACRIHPHKRLDDLLDAFRLALPRMPGARLRIAGGADSGEEAFYAELQSRAADLPVEWIGELRGNALAEFHASLDIFAMISEPAGCPNASLEAMASGLPLVTTDVGGVSEQVIDGVTGRLVPARDAKAFADALAELAGCAECRARMGAASRQHIEERFTVERMARDYRALLAGNPD